MHALIHVTYKSSKLSWLTQKSEGMLLSLQYAKFLQRRSNAQLCIIRRFDVFEWTVSRVLHLFYWAFTGWVWGNFHSSFQCNMSSQFAKRSNQFIALLQSFSHCKINQSEKNLNFWLLAAVLVADGLNL